MEDAEERAETAGEVPGVTGVTTDPRPGRFPGQKTEKLKAEDGASVDCAVGRYAETNTCKFLSPNEHGWSTRCPGVYQKLGDENPGVRPPPERAGAG